ncbi:MAG: ribonuclease III [Nitrospirae bacterium]|nr:ribonuclease III [Nitrospirota bacterium]
MARSLIDVAQQRIGYRFRQPSLLDEALTHKSYVNEIKSLDKTTNDRDNERLEFLGDAVLSLIISDHLAGTCPDFTEGDLSKLKARLVSEASLAKAARGLELGALLRLGRGEELTQGREKNSLLANALEALIAAVYLDGGLEQAQTFTLRVLDQDIEKIHEAGGDAAGDYKTRLQEWCQKRFETLPQYVTIRESGPDHQKTFEVQVAIKGELLGVGVGRTKKEAEQMAAQQAVQQMAAP